VTNVFANFDAANYDRARPYFHPTVYSRLKAVLPEPFPRQALDVACGTGHSAEALLAIVPDVAAVDGSPAMLSRARRRDRIRYVQGVAEQLPFRSGEFDLLTVGLAIHWFDQGAFLREAHRVLRADGWLVVFDSGFCEGIRGRPDFASWLREYRDRFPSPPRAEDTLSETLASEAEFQCFHFEAIAHVAQYTAEGLAAYARSQSRVIDALSSGRSLEREVDDWLRRSLRPFFPATTAECEHRGQVWVYRSPIGSNSVSSCLRDS
jgi:SAM-dependent methyltransferase